MNMAPKKDKLKVAFIHPDMGIGGAERLVLDVASALSKKGHEILFLTNHFDPSHAFEELKTGDFPVKVYGDWIPRHICGRFQALCAYIRMIYLTLVYVMFHRNEDKPDLYFVDLIPIAIPFLKWANQQVIYYCHHPDLLASAPGGTLKQFYRKPIDWLELKSTAMADVILVNSRYTASIFKETFPEIVKPIQVLYPTIAYSYQETVKKLTPRRISEILPEIPSDGLVFLSVNRFHPAKKLDMAILAMDKLKTYSSPDRWNKTFLIIAGGFDPQSAFNASYFTSLKQLTSELDLEAKIIFLKSPSDQLKAELLMSCDCLIYTPIKEHFGIVPLEAMTVGKPVIACNSGGPRETVDHGHTGYLCEPNPESMAQFMQRVVEGTNSQEMGQKGKKILDEQFSYDSFAKHLDKIISTRVVR